jgi:hypothetical protein
MDKLPTGVSYEANRRIKKYKAKIKLQGKLTHLGYFRTAEEAAEAFTKAKAERDAKSQ